MVLVGTLIVVGRGCGCTTTLRVLTRGTLMVVIEEVRLFLDVRRSMWLKEVVIFRLNVKVVLVLLRSLW